MKKIIAWHFMKDKNGKPVLRNGTPCPKVGETLRYYGPVNLCSSGYHASKRLIDAIGYAPGPWLALVEVSGDIQEGNDKLVASSRGILAVANVERELHEFAVSCAVRALEKQNLTDERLYQAIDIKLAWLDGIASDDDLDAARAVAQAAARDAAQAAAVPVAWDAAQAAAGPAARDAAWDAAWDAARDAVGPVAWDAARDAAWDAVWDAAWGAAQAAARDAAQAAAVPVAWDAARDAAWNAARAAVGPVAQDAVWDAAWDAARAAVHAAAYAAAQAVAWDAAHAAVHAAQAAAHVAENEEQNEFVEEMMLAKLGVKKEDFI
jgi:hypothetical protein